MKPSQHLLAVEGSARQGQGLGEGRWCGHGSAGLRLAGQGLILHVPGEYSPSTRCWAHLYRLRPRVEASGAMTKAGLASGQTPWPIPHPAAG